MLNWSDVKAVWKDRIDFGRSLADADGESSVILRRTKTAGGDIAVDYQDGNDLLWKIKQLETSNWIGVSTAYSPTAYAYGSTLSAVQSAIEKYAGENKPNKLFSDFGGVRVDSNGHFWSRSDSWAEWQKLPIGYPPTPASQRYVASSLGYAGPPVLKAANDLDLANAIDSYAKKHAPVSPAPPAPPPIAGGGPIPGPGVVKPPPGSPPVPVPAPPVPPAPGAGPPQDTSDGATAVFLATGAGIAGWLLFA